MFGSAQISKYHDQQSGHDKQIIHLEKPNNLIVYQTWTEDSLLLNNKKRSVFTIPPTEFVNIVTEFNKEHPTEKYMPTCVIKDTNTTKVYYTVCEDILTKFDAENEPGLVLVLDNNISNVTKNKDGTRVEELDDGPMNLSINFSSLPYSDINYNHQLDGNSPLLGKLNLKPPNKKDSNNFLRNNVKTRIAYSFRNDLRYKKSKAQPVRSFNFILQDTKHQVLM